MHTPRITKLDTSVLVDQYKQELRVVSNEYMIITKNEATSCYQCSQMYHHSSLKENLKFQAQNHESPPPNQ